MKTLLKMRMRMRKMNKTRVKMNKKINQSKYTKQQNQIQYIMKKVKTRKHREKKNIKREK
jgi:hypothetical protein